MSMYPISMGISKSGVRGKKVAIKIKGSQGNPRVEWLKVEHPFTAISLASDVHANLWARRSTVAFAGVVVLIDADKITMPTRLRDYSERLPCNS